MKTQSYPVVIGLPFIPQLIYRWLLLLLLLTGWSFAGFSQELVFKQATLLSGKEGADGAVYKFTSVLKNVDALVKINGRSSSLVKLAAIDLYSKDYDNAFQPKVIYNDGAVNSAANWWMEFEISFINTGSSTPADISNFNITALDVDGNSDKVHEYVSFYGLQSYSLDKGSLLNTTDIRETILGLAGVTGKEFNGPVTSFSNTDISTAQVSIAAQYTNTNKFRVRAGAVSTGKSSAPDGLYTYSFKPRIQQEFLYKILQVKLSYFDVSHTDDKEVVLNWGTEQEKNTNHFVVERSFNGSDYAAVGILLNTGNNTGMPNTYTFTDKLNTVNRMIYYRLKIVDFNNRAEVSNALVVRNEVKKEMAAIFTYPNPAQNEVRISLPFEWQNKPVRIDLYNMNGSTVKQSVTARSNQTESMNLTDLNPGIYVVKVFNGQETAVQRIIKSK